MGQKLIKAFISMNCMLCDEAFVIMTELAGKIGNFHIIQWNYNMDFGYDIQQHVFFASTHAFSKFDNSTKVIYIPRLI